MIEHVFAVPERLSWAQAHALEVGKLRATGLTIERLVEHFGKCTPTIRKALRHAARRDESAKRLPKKMPRGNWAEDHSAEVKKLKAKASPSTS